MSDTVTRVMLATRLDPGVQLNDTYEIDERIASGGMGEVYRGHNIQTGEPVAIKTILPELADKEAIFALFKKEATILGRLYHDTIVRYYSFSRDPRLGRPYLAMEFVDGISLADRMKATPLSADEVRKLFPSVADGLALAHNAGVIHRDLSPDNIILRDGDVSRPKLIDFGIARSANFGEGTLIGGGFAGKYNFISPEQLGLHNREVDGRSDIYSLALTIAASLRGVPLEMGGSHVEVIEKRSKVPDLSGIDESIRPLIESMLQPNPDDRPANAGIVAQWLRESKWAEPAASPAVATPATLPPAPAQAPAQPPSIPWTMSGAPAGTPFAGAPSQPPSPRGETPFATPTPLPVSNTAPPAGESPFGAVAAYPAPPLRDLPGTAAGNRTQARKSRGGRNAIAAVLAVVVAGGGAAYIASRIGPGMFGLGGPTTSDSGGTTPSGEQPTTGQPGGTTPTATGTQTATSTEEAKPKEVARVEEPTAPTQPSTESAVAQPEVVATAPTTEEPGGETVPIPGGSTAGPSDAMREAAAGLTNMMDVGVNWLRQYNGGKCFFVAVTSVTSESIAIKGFGPDVASFQTLYNDFMKANGVEPELNGHLITESQCAAAEFLKAVQPDAKDNPQVTLAADRVKLGDTLTATVDNAEGKVLDLLLISGDGLVYNVKSFAAQTINNGRMSFEMWLGGLHIDGESPEMIIALTSKNGLQVPQGKDHARAAALFLKLAKQIKDSGENIGMDFAYFRASP